MMIWIIRIGLIALGLYVLWNFIFGGGPPSGEPHDSGIGGSL
jgi:hypothetical protein